jgi:hypothetical protein
MDDFNNRNSNDSDQAPNSIDFDVRGSSDRRVFTFIRLHRDAIPQQVLLAGALLPASIAALEPVIAVSAEAAPQPEHFPPGNLFNPPGLAMEGSGHPLAIVAIVVIVIAALAFLWFRRRRSALANPVPYKAGTSPSVDGHVGGARRTSDDKNMPIPSEGKNVVEEQWRRWAEKEFAGPPSRILAATAAAMRAIESHRDQAHVVAAARSAAEIWKPAEAWKPGGKTDVAEEQWRRWAEKEFGGPTSRILAATAAAIRAIELRQNEAHVFKAARSAAEAWKPVAVQSAAQSSVAPVSRSADVGEAPPGVVRGQVAGLVQRKILAPAPLRMRQQIANIMWSFSLYRAGLGANGRPLSPVPVQLQNWRIDGVLEDGDIVEFDGHAPPATVMQPKRLRNISKGTTIRVRGTYQNPDFWVGQTLTLGVLFLFLWYGFHSMDQLLR